MKSAVALLFTLSAACSAGPADDDTVAFPIGDGGKADGFWSNVTMLGDLAYDTPVPLDLPASHVTQYRGFRLDGSADDLLDVTLQGSGTDQPSLVVYDAGKKPIASNLVYAGQAPLAHVSVPLAADGTIYVVVFNDDDRAAHLVVTATHAPVCHPKLCTSDDCGFDVANGCGAKEWCGECLPTTTDPVCASFGLECGRIYPPGYTGGVECGGCGGGASCGGGGEAEVCGEEPSGTWLADLPQHDGNWNGTATFTLAGVRESGPSGLVYPSGTITCGVAGVVGDGLPYLSCRGPHGVATGQLRSDGSFKHDDRDIVSSYDEIVFAGVIEPHGLMRLSEYSETYLSSTNGTAEWAFPCLLYRIPTGCVAGTSWRSNAVATLH